MPFSRFSIAQRDKNERARPHPEKFRLELTTREHLMPIYLPILTKQVTKNCKNKRLVTKSLYYENSLTLQSMEMISGSGAHNILKVKGEVIVYSHSRRSGRQFYVQITVYTIPASTS